MCRRGAARGLRERRRLSLQARAASAGVQWQARRDAGNRPRGAQPGRLALLRPLGRRWRPRRPRAASARVPLQRTSGRCERPLRGTSRLRPGDRDRHDPPPLSTPCSVRPARPGMPGPGVSPQLRRPPQNRRSPRGGADSTASLTARSICCSLRPSRCMFSIMIRKCRSSRSLAIRSSSSLLSLTTVRTAANRRVAGTEQTGYNLVRGRQSHQRRPAFARTLPPRRTPRGRDSELDFRRASFR